MDDVGLRNVERCILPLPWFRLLRVRKECCGPDSLQSHHGLRCCTTTTGVLPHQRLSEEPGASTTAFSPVPSVRHHSPLSHASCQTITCAQYATPNGWRVNVSLWSWHTGRWPRFVEHRYARCVPYSEGVSQPVSGLGVSVGSVAREVENLFDSRRRSPMLTAAPGTW